MLKKLIANQDIKAIEAYMQDYHDFDIAQIVQTLTDDEKNYLFSVLNPEIMADILSYLKPEDAADTLADFSLNTQKEIIEELDPDDAADIIQELSDDNQEKLINALNPDEEVLNLLSYGDDEAGSHMTNEFIKVNLDDDVKVATKKLIKSAPDVGSVQTIFVIDEKNHYVGQVSLKNLIKAKYPLTIRDIYEVEPTFNDHGHIDELVKHMKHYGAYDMGIVNQHNQLIGTITMDDVLDIYQDESEEDYERLAALPDTSVTQGVLKSAVYRLPWIIFLLILSMPIALITNLYEHVIASVIILALFQPLILDSGGNVASQTLAVTLISMTNKDAKIFKNGMKEILSGIISGFVMGLAAFAIVYLFSGFLSISHVFSTALVIGFSLWLTVILGPILGFFIPIGLKAIKLDPAVASGPFIITLIDILSLVIYFTTATLLLGGIIHA